MRWKMSSIDLKSGRNRDDIYRERKKAELRNYLIDRSKRFLLKIKP